MSDGLLSALVADTVRYHGGLSIEGIARRMQPYTGRVLYVIDSSLYGCDAASNVPVPGLWCWEDDPDADRYGYFVLKCRECDVWVFDRRVVDSIVVAH